MTDQEFFDASVAHLRRQGAKASEYSSSGAVISCMYRGPGGRACGVGGVMPDYLAQIVSDRGFNAKRISTVLDHVVEARLFFDGVTGDLLFDMQDVHDNSAVEEWERRFQRLANSYSLVYTPPGAQA